MAELLTLADIVGAHGVRGWIKIRPYLEDPKILTSLGPLQLGLGERARTKPGTGSTKAVEIDSVRRQGKGIIAHIVGVDDRSEAEALRGLSIKAAVESLPEARIDEIYWRDLVGMFVLCRDPDAGSEDPVLLGTIDYLLDTGANDVMVIKATEASIDDRERLIPWVIDSVVTRVDTEAGEVWVTWYVDD